MLVHGLYMANLTKCFDMMGGHSADSLMGCVEGFQACGAEGEGDDNSFSHTDHVVHDA